MGTRPFNLQNITKNLDPSLQMDLDFLDYFGEEISKISKSVLLDRSRFLEFVLERTLLSNSRINAIELHICSHFGGGPSVLVYYYGTTFGKSKLCRKDS